MGDEQPCIDVEVGRNALPGMLVVPPAAKGLVLFAHGSGSSRLSVRNQFVAEQLQQAGLATLLFDLLLPAEAEYRANVFDVELLAERVCDATEWSRRQDDVHGLAIGLFGASTGAAAALISAAQIPICIGAVVTRGGRPDLARNFLKYVKAPTLLIVGERDEAVLELNQGAFQELHCKKQLQVVKHATHLFSEPGTLEQVSLLSSEWFCEHLTQTEGRQ